MTVAFNLWPFLFLIYCTFGNQGLAAAEAVKWKGRGGHSGSSCLGWQQRWTCRRSASQTSSQPATGLDHFLHILNREKNKLLMCWSRLPSTVQMRCCPVQLNAVHKYSNPIESQWLKQRQRQGKRKTDRVREGEREGEREAVYTPCPHFYQAVSGVQGGSHCRLGNSWWERGERGHLNTDSFRSDATLWCE